MGAAAILMLAMTACPDMGHTFGAAPSGAVDPALFCQSGVKGSAVLDYAHSRKNMSKEEALARFADSTLGSIEGNNDWVMMDDGFGILAIDGTIVRIATFEQVGPDSWVVNGTIDCRR